jgi:hypothetical protein
LKSAFTIATKPKFAKAPRIIPHGKCNNLAAASFDLISSEAYLSNHLNLLSDSTNTPL